MRKDRSIKKMAVVRYIALDSVKVIRTLHSYISRILILKFS